MRFGSRRIGSMICVLIVASLAVGMTPHEAFAYFNRGSVSVSLGTTAVEVRAGETSSVTVSITPSSDDQTEGCGMPKCPQGCAESCVDENGQCRCAGTEYHTYYATAVASSSNAAVAVATYSGGALTVYGKSEGEATITVRASLRQYTDAETTLKVTVSGTASGSQSGTPEFVDIPLAAEATQEDKLDVVDKTAMGRPIRFVRINEACDSISNLDYMAGKDGDLTFWQGDTYYRPDYSLTFTGTDYASVTQDSFDVGAKVGTEPTSKLNQPLDGLSDYLIIDMAQAGKWFSPATIYALADGVFSDGDPVALFSYDEASRAFVHEGEEAAVVGGYVVFRAQEGKTYVVSSRDLTTDANVIVSNGNGTAAVESCCDPGPATSTFPVIPVAIGVLVGAAVAAVVIVLVMRRKKRKALDGSKDE